jgi:hypothetical protein
VILNLFHLVAPLIDLWPPPPPFTITYLNL